MEYLIENIKNRLTELGWTQGVLSFKTGISLDAISWYLSGKCRPNAENMTKIAKALGLTIEDLLSYSDAKPMVEINPSGCNIPDLDKFDLHKFIDECVGKKDRYVSIYFSPHGVTVSVYPFDEDED